MRRIEERRIDHRQSLWALQRALFEAPSVERGSLQTRWQEILENRKKTATETHKDDELLQLIDVLLESLGDPMQKADPGETVH